MESILKKIQDTVLKYANVLSQILMVDVEIVDNKLVRIAATGEYSNLINEDINNEGYVYKKVLATGKSQIIDNPGLNELCESCKMYKTCIEKFEMCVPISINDEIAGVIGLICFTDNQKDYILKNIDIYKSFLYQISDFISAKAFETIEKEKIIDFMQLLKYITDEIEEAVIILDKDSNISYANTKAINIFKINKDNIKNKKARLKHTGKYILDKKEYKLTLCNRNYYLAGNMNVIDNSQNLKIFIFDKTETIKNQINKLTDMGDTVIFNNILGTSRNIMEAKNKIMRAKDSLSIVLIKGESGVGKELFARTIHKASRENKLFVPVNCSLTSESLFVTVLNNIKKGSTLFLDEVDCISPYMQTKLLEFIYNNERVIAEGDNFNENIRIIAATNKNIEKLVENGTLRKDLFYKLYVLPIEIPPLRDRMEDVKIITYYYFNKYSKLFSKKIIGIDDDVWDILCEYSWPDNIRELQNTVEFMINMMDDGGIINKECIPKRILDKIGSSKTVRHNGILNLKKLECDAINKALKLYGTSTKGKKTAADSLGIGIATLYRKIEEYKLQA